MENNIIDLKAIKAKCSIPTEKEEVLEEIRNDIKHFYTEIELDKLIAEKNEAGFDLVTTTVEDAYLFSKYLCDRNKDIHYTKIYSCISEKSTFIRTDIIYRNNSVSPIRNEVMFLPKNVIQSMLYYLVNKDLV